MQQHAQVLNVAGSLTYTPKLSCSCSWRHRQTSKVKANPTPSITPMPPLPLLHPASPPPSTPLPLYPPSAPAAGGTTPAGRSTESRSKVQPAPDASLPSTTQMPHPAPQLPTASPPPFRLLPPSPSLSRHLQRAVQLGLVAPPNRARQRHMRLHQRRQLHIHAGALHAHVLDVVALVKDDDGALDVEAHGGSDAGVQQVAGGKVQGGVWGRSGRQVVARRQDVDRACHAGGMITYDLLRRQLVGREARKWGAQSALHLHARLAGQRAMCRCCCCHIFQCTSPRQAYQKASPAVVSCPPLTCRAQRPALLWWTVPWL